ncbi:TrmB family transcriptional regulator [Haloglomus halophilum]|uniref:TrmB family transcriptional regulator n=1 Tax=Haloglomus halophilum TaxID=2962672 RepID=UPI0020C9F314|nr:helix-turn-helix domain-containing protein [Haloglomus halophilum]
MPDGDGTDLFDALDLTEYEETALSNLLRLGRTTAPNLAEATGIPKARIYGVLDALADRGFVKVIPGRPKEYQSRSPAEIVDRAKENQRQAYESTATELEAGREAFLAEFGPQFDSATEDVRPAEELFHVVDVGEPSESETRRLYHEAEREVRVLTKSWEYLESVEPALRDALDRGIAVRVLFLHPDRLSDENRRIQAGIVDRLREEFPGVEFRFAAGALPWRGTLTDPPADAGDAAGGESGEAIFLVEEPEVPNHMRQAAITENESFVAGLKRFFDLVWEHESVDRRDD